MLEIAKANPYAYKKKPRLATALQLLHVSRDRQASRMNPATQHQ